MKLIENKILKLFEKQDTISMNNDIFPILFEEFADCKLDEQNYELIHQYIEQLLCGCYAAGVNIVAVPTFTGIPQEGSLIVSDILYKKL